LKTTGTEIDKILPEMSRFSEDANRASKKETVVAKLRAFFEKFIGLLSIK
jgi:type I restriction enzyme R subunit